MPWKSSTSWNPVKRGLYGGACGYLSFSGEMDMAIAIRTGIVKNGMLYVQAAAGIVADSVPLPVHDVTVSSLAWIGDLAALVVLLGAGLALAFGSRWGRGSRRYDAPVDPAGSAGAGIASAASGVPGPPGDAAGVADGPGAAEPRQPGTSGRPRNATSGAGRTEASHVSEAASRRADDDWDALSRGEDPTL
jgi:hypothetical protein